MTTLQERLEIIGRSEAGERDVAIAAEMQCSVWTVRKWRRTGQRNGRGGLTPRRGRPRAGPLGTAPSLLLDIIRELRQTHPGWGPATILAELRSDSVWQTRMLPSRARVAAFLKDEGFTRSYQRHSRLPQPRLDAPACPHDEWQLDAQGVTMVAGVGKVNLINAVDVVSRMKVESYPSVGTTNPPTEDYFLALRHAFLTYGLPERISFDHGTVFFDNTTTSPFPTRLHLWLVALGVDVSFIRTRRPTDHAIVERTHQTMSRQALDGQCWPDEKALWAGLDERRHMLNTQMPTKALNGGIPLQTPPSAGHSGRSYRPEWEAQLLDIERVHRYLARGRWFRQIKANGYIQIGGYQYHLGKRVAGLATEVTFDPRTGHLLFHLEGKQVAVAVAIAGLTVNDLMGELAGITRLPTYQLALPLSPAAYRQQHYAEYLTGMNS